MAQLLSIFHPLRVLGSSPRLGILLGREPASPSPTPPAHVFSLSPTQINKIFKKINKKFSSSHDLNFDQTCNVRQRSKGKKQKKQSTLYTHLPLRTGPWAYHTRSMVGEEVTSQEGSYSRLQVSTKQWTKENKCWEQWDLCSRKSRPQWSRRHPGGTRVAEVDWWHLDLTALGCVWRATRKACRP